MFRQQSKNAIGETVEVITKNINGKGALIGAGIGLGISAIKNPNFSKDMFRKK
ncbi:hypothetical protein [Paraclostridium dentum]|uniref:hypothetical protein n=1 Tax=Paraclostridium dentum TaxID=2662455 RepID=UPI003F350400